MEATAVVTRVDGPDEPLGEAAILEDPIAQVRIWWEEARADADEWADAAVLATATPDADPAARAVIVRGLDHGFVFYTDRSSRKGRELEENPRASLVFLWPTRRRQVRVDGHVEVVSDVESDAYWAGRPRGAQLSATASRQSEVVAGRDELERRVAAVTAEYADRDVPRPERWGGYRVIPEAIELWQQRADRLHDRLRYIRVAERWRVERLWP